LNLFPSFKTKEGFADKYVKINEVLNNLALKYKITLWQLDEIVGWIALGYPPISSDITPEIKEDLESREELESYEDFGLESHLEDFLVENWEKLELGKKYSILEENGDIVGQQYFTPIGKIDILAKSKDGSEWLIVELKKGKSSDQVVGQTLRYIGWIKENKAKGNEKVKGLIIVGEKDDKLRYALQSVNNIDLMTYSVNFKLQKE
jgi:restriction system protein